jgi:hypothetical protein
MELKEITKNYLNGGYCISSNNVCCPTLDDVLNYFNKLKKIEEVIDKSIICNIKLSDKVEIKKHSHQKYMTAKTITEIKKKLLAKKNNIESVQNFEELYKVIDSNKVKGFGLLAIYDSALRIGAFLNIYPNDVYIQSGALEGAKNLGLDVIGRRCIPVQDFPKELRSLKPYHIEDILCIYKNQLK